MHWKQLAVFALVVAIYLFCLWLSERPRHRQVKQADQLPPEGGPAAVALAVPEPIDDEATARLNVLHPDRTPIDESLTGRVDPGPRARGQR